MNKADLLDRMGALGEERMLLARILDRCAQAERHNTPAATDFLTPQQQLRARELLRLWGADEERYAFCGGYDEAERKLIYFLPQWMDREDIQPPIRVLRARFRQEEKLTHRDFLGSLVGMGIVREKVGDILVGPESADLLVADTVADFLVQNWNSAGRARLTVEEVDPLHIHIPQARQEEVRDTVSSLRLDAVAAAGFGMARGKAAELIAAGRVEVNWQVCTKADKPLQEGDTVSGRGYGKFVLAQIGGTTRKGRISLVLRRYQ